MNDAIPRRLESAIKPDTLLTLSQFDQQQIDTIAQTVPAGMEGVQDMYPLSPAQEGILFHHLLDEQSDTYVLSTLFEIESRARLDALIDGLQAVINRHDALRTAVVWSNLPQPVQVVHRDARLPIEEAKLDPDRDPIEQLTHRMKSQSQGFNLQRAPLLRLKIAADTHGARWYALLQRHHIVFDHQSWSAAFAEAIACMQGRECDLGVPLQYKHYVASVLAHSMTQQAEAFFRAKLGDVEEPTAPLGLLDVRGDASQIAEAHERLDPSLAHRVRLQAQALGVTAAKIFHAMWALVVAHTSGRNDIVYGTVLSTAQRKRREAQCMLGLFVNTLPLRLTPSGVTARELVEQVRRELEELRAHKHASLALAQRCTGNGGSAPVFTALLNYRHSEKHSVVDPKADCSGAVGIRVLGQNYRTNYPVTLVVDDMGDGFTLTAQTDRQVDPRRILGYAQAATQSLVEALERGDQTPAWALSILPEGERREMLELFNATPSVHPQAKVVHELFEEQARRTPSTLAVVSERRSLTYALLNAKANQVARYLRNKGVGPDDVVGVCIDRDLEMIVAIVGILKAGAAYVPLDPNYPTERLKYMLEDARPRVVLTQKNLKAALPEVGADLVALDPKMRAIDECSMDDRAHSEVGVSHRNLVYVIYTSGSTGKPKGIEMTHGAMVNLIEWHRTNLPTREGQRVLQFAALSFDVAFQEIFSTLCTGGTLVLVDEETRRDAESLTTFVALQAIERLFVPPLMLQSVAECVATGRTRRPSALREVITAGEQLRVTPEISGLFKALHGCKLHNHYGPAETHVVTSLTLTGDPDKWPVLPAIGRPISNAQVYVLDAQRQPVPIGVTGEIYIGGKGVARGYVRKPELTVQRFVPDPFGPDSEAHIYKTGDLGRWSMDGNLEYLGRNDDQVKIRGYRIELGEIEAQLIQHPRVKDAAVVAREDVPGEKRLVAYVTQNDSVGQSVEELRAYLKAVLPPYMVPSAFVTLESFPLTPNGKLDRRGLPAPELEAYADQKYEAPQGEVEKTLAGIWEDLLKVKRIGRRDNFFDLGGHSLLTLKALFRINQSFGSTLRVLDVYKSPTLQELATRIHGTTIEDELVDLSREAVLDADIVAKPGRQLTPPKAIMLTGATGFVGRFLLVQLLQDTNAIIHCLVRLPSQHQAMSRLKATLAKWDLWRDEFEARIVAVPGNLRLPRLGVDALSYRLLSEQVDTIYHCASSMNHLETYEMAKAANVGSARELLRLATTAKPKLINYISTLGVFSALGTQAARCISEASPIDQEHHRKSKGYVASKWVADRIFMTASERGIPCNIFRLGLIWGDMQHGRYDELQREYRVLKSCLLSGYGIEKHRYDMAPIPVDFAARAVVLLANRHAEGKGIFHIASRTQMLDGTFERLNEIAETSLELMPLYDWLCEIKRLHHEGQSFPVVPLVEYAFSMNEDAFADYVRRYHSTSMQFDCDRTRRELERSGLTIPVFGDDLLAACCESMLSRDPELRELATRKRSFRLLQGDASMRLGS